LGADGQRYAQDDGRPLDGLQPMGHWVRGEVLPDERLLALPTDLPPGRYRLDVGFYLLESGDRLEVRDAQGRDRGQALAVDFVRVPAPGETLPAPSQALAVELAGGGDRIALLGYDLATQEVQSGHNLPVTLYWQALDRVARDYTVFRQLLAAGEAIRGQGDGLPLDGFYPTSYWDPGEIVADAHPVAVDDDAPPGAYRLVAGLYWLPTGERLATGDGDRVLLDQVEVVR
jgi:hypothetical protein